MTYGHASLEQTQYIESLERCLSPDTSPLAQVLEWAVLLIEPSHREDDAVPLLRRVLARDPQCDEARLWLVSCFLHALMTPENLAEAKTILEEMIARQGSLVGAAYMLLYDVLYEIASVEGKEFDLGEGIQLLKASVQHEPNWTANRASLAYAYREQGDIEAAIAEMKAALRCMRWGPEMGPWVEYVKTVSLHECEYEYEITGRLRDPTIYMRDLAGMESSLEARKAKPTSG